MNDPARPDADAARPDADAARPDAETARPDADAARPDVNGAARDADEAQRDVAGRERGTATGSTETRLPRGLRAFSHRNFRLFWSGQVVSLVGTWMQTVAQGWLVLQLTNDPVALGIVSACQFTPIMLLGLFGGVLADMLPKRRTLAVLQLAALCQAVALGLLVAGGSVQVWQVYLLSVVLGVINAIEMPVRQSFSVEMVGREHIASAVAMNSAAFNASRIVGPAIAGVLIGVAGLAPAFFVNAVSYLASFAALISMRNSELLTTARLTFVRERRAVLDQLTEGLRYVRGNPPVLLGISIIGFVSTVGMNFQVIMPVMARDVLLGGPDAFGFLMAAAGIGSLIGAFAVAFRDRPALKTIVSGAAVFGVALVGVAISRNFAVSLLLMGIVGFALIAMAATTNTFIQVTVPDELRGRVSSVYTTVFAGSTPIGGIFAGVVAGMAGAPASLLLGGLLAVLTAVIAWWKMPGRTSTPRSVPQHRPGTG